MSFSNVLGKSVIELALDKAGYTRALDQVEKQAEGKGKSIGDKLKLGMGAGALAAGTAIVAGLGSAVSLAGDFEHAVDQIGAVSGATAQELDGLGKTALRIGKDTAFSATEAAGAMEILAANGVSAADIMNGAADATVALAAAGGTDLARAADTASTAMAVWNIGASDMTDVVNRLAGAANVSRFGVEDMSLAIAQGGGAAKTAGVEFGDFTTTIAAIAPNFSSGADAGTSLKTMLMRLSPQTDKAAGAMADLGIITEESGNRFFDANGNLKSMAEISDILHDATKDLNEEQKTQALTTIFGTDAMRAAAGIAGLTGEEFRKMSDQMGNTSAAEVAKQRMDNLHGATENLMGSLETVGIEIGTQLLPKITDLTQKAADLAPKITDIFNWLTGHSTEIEATAVAFGAFVATTKGFSMIQGIPALFTAISTGIKGVNLSLLSPPGIALLFAGIATAIFLVWKHWDQIWPTLSQGWDAMKKKAGEIKDGVVRFFGDIKDGIVSRIGAARDWLNTTWESVKTKAGDSWSWIKTTVTSFVGGIKDGIVSRITEARTWLDTTWEGVKTKASDAWSWLKTTAGSLWGGIKTSVMTPIQEARDWLATTWETIKTKAGDTWTWVKNTFENSKQGIKNALMWPFEQARDNIGNVMGAFKSIMAGPWNAAADGINGFIVGTVLAINWVGRQLGIGDVIGWGGLPKIPRFAKGGVTPGGPIIAGERGAELLMPPKGTRVFNAAETIAIFEAVNGRQPEGAPLGKHGPLGLGAGPLDGVVSAVKGMASSAADAARAVLDKGVDWLIQSALGGLSLNTGGGALGSLGAGIFTTVKGMAVDLIKQLFDAVKDALPDTVPNGDAILAMAQQTPGTYLWCEKFVGDVMSRLGLRYSREPTAAIHAGKQPLNPGFGPRGAIVYFPWTSGGVNYGHVAFSGGDNGSIYGTMNNSTGTGWMRVAGWQPYGWTATPFADGGIVTKPVNGLVGEAGSEAIIPLSEFPDIMTGALTPTFNDLYKPTGKAGQAFGDVIDTGLATNKALAGLADTSKEGAVQVSGSVALSSATNSTHLLAAQANITKVQQSVDTMAVGTNAGLAGVDQSILAGSQAAETAANKGLRLGTTVLEVLQNAVTGSGPWHVITDGGSGASGSGAVSGGTSSGGGSAGSGSDVISGSLTPGMGGLINPAPPGSPENPIELTPTSSDVILGSNYHAFAAGGLVRGRHPLLGLVGEGRHDEIISPVPTLRDLLGNLLERAFSDHADRTPRPERRPLTININGPLTATPETARRLARDIDAELRRRGIA